jgi:N-acetylmuramoyl-L-alanine amidase
MKNNKLKKLDDSFKEFSNAYMSLREDILSINYGVKSNWCIGVSAGHGGIDPLTGSYTTSGKQFYHNGLDLHNSGNFYEGVFNRQIADKLVARLKEEKIVYEKFYHPYLDMTLSNKSSMVNKHHAGVKKTILFELHSNACTNHNARGFSVYTSPGETDSDKLATVLWNHVAEFADKYGVKMRAQESSDGDVDYEEKFHMLTKTACPAILPECLFFDNREDVVILNNEDFQNEYVEALLLTAKWGQKNL